MTSDNKDYVKEQLFLKLDADIRKIMEERRSDFIEAGMNPETFEDMINVGRITARKIIEGMIKTP